MISWRALEHKFSEIQLAGILWELSRFMFCTSGNQSNSEEVYIEASINIWRKLTEG